MTVERQKTLWSRGQSAVEFAMVATAFFLFISGVMMMGDAVLAYNSMSAAADEAVRYAVANGPNSSSPATQATIEQVAVSIVPQLHLTCTGCPGNSGNGNVTSSWVTDTNMTASGWQDAKVVINYPYVLKIPFMSSVTLNLTATSQMMESQGPSN
jgi:Flp pilus assembly protein TadG